jgi:ABC-type protease/lipase transport system fused ATPase/permease subunit
MRPGALKRVGFFSMFINLLTLTSSIYMMQVDRVLASRSGPTLLYLTLFAAACLATLAALEVVRSRLLVRLGARFDAQLSGLVFIRTLSGGRSAQALRDLDQLRGFLTGAQILSLLDAPWMPIYIGLVYLLHPWLGHVALVGGVLLFLLALWNERSTREPWARRASRWRPAPSLPRCRRATPRRSARWACCPASPPCGASGTTWASACRVWPATGRPTWRRWPRRCASSCRSPSSASAPGW